MAVMHGLSGKPCVTLVYRADIALSPERATPARLVGIKIT